jgi:predicted PP-loop superfamily ATPase
MSSPHCLRCSSTRRRLILVTNTASRARFHLCGKCLALVVKEMRPRSSRSVEVEIIKQSSRRAS